LRSGGEGCRDGRRIYGVGAFDFDLGGILGRWMGYPSSDGGMGYVHV
jgi:hypothetical protein